MIWTFYNEFMFEVRVEADFAAAHFLKDYNGKCENLHGHNYKVFAHSKLKNALRKCCKKIDHTNLNDFEVFEQNPSAERIAVFIYENILQEMKENGIDLSYSEGKKEPFLYAVDVFETETSRARYCSC